MNEEGLTVPMIDCNYFCSHVSDLEMIGALPVTRALKHDRLSKCMAGLVVPDVSGGSQVR
jgi:hypothetical protein